MMASITIKGVPSELHEGLKEAARRNHRSLRDEIIACLERHVERLPYFDHALVDEFKRAGR